MSGLSKIEKETENFKKNYENEIKRFCKINKKIKDLNGLGVLEEDLTSLREAQRIINFITGTISPIICTVIDMKTELKKKREEIRKDNENNK